MMLVGIAAAAAPLSSFAQDPRTIRFVVPFPPGGLNDTVARLLAEAMQADLGQTIVIDNRPGAAGLLGTQAVAEAAGDGSTWLVTSLSNHVLAPLTQKAARVDPPRDLQPVGLALRTVGVLVAAAGVPASSLREFIALAKARPGQLNYASSGVGSANHVQVERFNTLAGIHMVNVPYRGGGPLMTALMAGEVQFGLMDLASAEPALKSGKAKALAQTGVRRHSGLPQVPTLAESGFASYDPTFWIGLAAPKSTPAAAVARMNTALRQALQQTAIKARAQALGWTLVGSSPEAMAELITRESAEYRETITGMKLDRQ